MASLGDSVMLIIFLSFKKEQLICKPDSVLGINPSFCHLSELRLTPQLKLPTPQDWASSPQTLIYAELQHTGANSCLVTQNTGKLLPYLLTLTARQACGGYFLLCIHTLAGIFQLRRALLCVVRTFLCLPKQAATKRLTAMQI